MPGENEIEFAEIKDVEVFAVGTWDASTGTITITGEMLDDMVRSFNELSAQVTGFRPPLKLGHSDAQRFLGQKNGFPALGWVSSLRRVGDKIVADFSDVPSSLVDLIRRRLYNSVSIEVLPKLSYAGSTFKNVLGAVALLGAELPAVKGLKELSLSLFDATLTDRIVLSAKQEGRKMADYSQAQLDSLIEAAVLKATNTAKAEFEAQINALKQEFDGKLAAEKTRADAAEKKVKDNETAAAEFAEKQRKANVEAAVDQAVKEGKLLPKDKEATLAFGMTLDQTTKLKFGAAESTAFEQWKAGLLKAPKKVDFAEHTAASDGSGDEDKRADIVVNERAQRKVIAAGGAEKLSFATAVDIVLNEDPALKARYVALN